MAIMAIVLIVAYSYGKCTNVLTARETSVGNVLLL